MRLTQYLNANARFQPDKVALKFEGECYTYAHLEYAVQHCCERMTTEWGIKQGDRIAILALNHPATFLLIFAAARAGAIIVPLNWRLADEELTYILNDCTPSVLLFDKDNQGRAATLNAQTGNLPESHVMAMDALSLKKTLGADHTHESDSTFYTNIVDKFSPDQDLLIVYTSGTTGRPKGAVLSEAAILCSAAMSRHAYQINEKDVVLNVLPLFHIGGINIQPLPALIYGAELILHKQVDPDLIINTIQSERVTLINSVPTILQAVVQSDNWNNADLSSLKSISIGSTDVPQQLIQQVFDKHLALVQIYGATETGPAAIYQKPEFAKETLGSIGREGAFCNIRLCDQDGNEVVTGEPGEIWVQGANILSCYWNNKSATEEAIVNGWFKTGDVARKDDNGDYWFVDRIKHVIISGGENIYAAEVERVLRTNPAIKEVAVVGRPDPRWGEVPVAVFSISAVNEQNPDLNQNSGQDQIPGQTRNLGQEQSIDTIKKNLKQLCSETLASFKCPKDYIQVDKLPRNAMGKIQVDKVREIVQNQTADTSNNPDTLN